MRTSTYSLIVALALMCMSQKLDAYLPGGPFELVLDIVMNPVDGNPEVVCDLSEIIAKHSNIDWSFSMIAPIGKSEGAKKALGSSISCGAEAREMPEPGTEESEPGIVPYLLGSGSTRVSVIRQMQNERVVSVKVSAYLQLQPQPEGNGSSETMEEKIEREFFFTENRTVLVPLLLTNERQQESLPVREIFLRISLRVQTELADLVYGIIWVSSELHGADILLDGGLVGQIPESGELFLRNVAVGHHLVTLQGPQGNQVTKAVRVIPSRTVMAILNSPVVEKTVPRFQLENLGENEKGYQEYRRLSDDNVAIKIPEGEFLMGNSETERTPLEHDVWLSTYMMDKTGITWGQFKVFADSTGIPLPAHDPFWGIHDDHPAVFVTWEEADNYCAWAGGRLPTEAEREKAARGTDKRMFPWGNEAPNQQLAVFRRSWGYAGTDPVGRHHAGASPYGLLDVGGNVWEWCADWYDVNYYEASPYRDPKGPASGIAHVVRGGSWDSRPSVLSSSCRSFGHRGYREGDFGFRCAMNSQE